MNWPKVEAVSNPNGDWKVCEEHGGKVIADECTECGGSGTFCPSFDPGGSDKCGGCEECPHCGGTGVAQ